MAQNKGPIGEEYGGGQFYGRKREFLFCLYLLASGCKKPKWAAGQAGYSGDLAKRSRSLLDLPRVQEFLEKYAPPVNRFSVKSDKDSIIKRLEQIASGEGVDKTAALQLKAIELMGKAQGLWEGTSSEGRDRLREILSVWEAGPVGREVCPKCQKHHGSDDQYCRYCGAVIEKKPTPVETLAAAQKKLNIKERVQ
jgi:hypothetical protein